MILQKYRNKVSVFWKVLKFIYGRYPGASVTRDILAMLSTVADLYNITVVGKFIDEVAKIIQGTEVFNISTFFQTQAFLYLVLIFVLWSVSQICIQARDYLYDIIYESVWKDSKYMMIAKVSKSNFQDVEQENFQDLLAFVPAFSIDRLILTYSNFSIIISNVVKVIASVGIIFETMGWSALLLVLFVLPQVIAVHNRRKQIRNYQEKNVGRIKYLNYVANVALTISNFLELRVNDIFSFLKRRYGEEYDEYVGGYLKTDVNFYKDRAVFSIFGQLFKYAYIVYLLTVTVAKKLSLGTFKALYDYVDSVYVSMFLILDSVSFISIQMEYIEKFFDLMNFQGFGDQAHGDIKLKKGTPCIEFEHLTFAYPDDPKTKVLRNVNIKINPGEKVAFFGSDGSGKSSMVKILTGLYQIIQGEYLVDGHSVKDLDRGELKRKMAVTFQDFINYNFSVRENVVISGDRKNINKKLYKEVSKMIQIDQVLKKEKIDDEHLIGKAFPGGKELSPGYWQRLAISRMLYRDKRIFVMDESFTFIDSTAREDILKNVFDVVGEDRTLIYITRNVDNLDLFDKIYMFDNGRIIEAGNWRELMAKKGKFFGIVKESQ